MERRRVRLHRALFYNPTRGHSMLDYDPGDRVRNEGVISLGWCQRNPQQPKNVTYGIEAIIEMGGMSH